VSSLSRQESNAITGIPGLSEIPGFQNTTNNNSNLDVAELAIVITPHIVRGRTRGPRKDDHAADSAVKRSLLVLGRG